MRDEIFSLLESMGYKGLYLKKIKENFDWGFILEETKIYNNFQEKERLYLFLHPETIPYCENTRPKRFSSIQYGYKDICINYLECDKCKENVLNKTKKVWIVKYGVDNISKSKEIKDKKEKTSLNNWGVSQPLSSNIVREKRLDTIKEKYGEDVVNVFQVEKIKDKSRNTCIEKYGVDNVSKSEEIKQKKVETCRTNFGVDNPNQSEKVLDKRKRTNLEKYGFEYATKNKKIIFKMMETKTRKGSFSKPNSSKEATEFFRKYCVERNYSFDQVAFSDIENGLFEFGYNFKGKWYLYDFVAFEKGFRGNKDKIIEIVEYQGPFHYNEEDVSNRGNEMAFPWKSKNTTIKESYYLDKEKELLARENFTDNYNVVWSEKYHKTKGE